MAKKIRENGIVLSKFIKPATQQFIIDGRVIEAQPDRPTVVVACGEVNGDDGISEVQVARFVVEQSEYEKFKYLDTVQVAYEYNGDGKIKPLGISKLPKGAQTK